MRPNVALLNALCGSTVSIKTNQASGSKRVGPVFHQGNAPTRASGIPRTSRDSALRGYGPQGTCFRCWTNCMLLSVTERRL